MFYLTIVSKILRHCPLGWHDSKCFIFKVLTCWGMSINVYTKQVETILEPEFFFCSGIWGLTKFSEIACRYFLGVMKHCSNVFSRGDRGWSSCEVKTKLNLFVCGLGYKICQSTGLYDWSTIGLSLKVDHGRKRC